MHANFGWMNPIMGQEVRALYGRLYPNIGDGFVATLEDCPPEVAVISRLATYLKARKGGR